MNLMYQTKYKIFDIFILILNLMFILLSLYNFYFSKILLITTTIANITLLYKSIKQKSFFIMFFFWFTYIIYLYPYFFFGTQLTPFMHYQNEYIFTLTLIIHSIFLIFFNLFFKEIKHTDDPKKFIKIKDNYLFFIASIVIMIFIIVFGKAGETIFESGGYGRNLTTNFLNLAIYEYYYIFFLLAVKYSDLKKPRLFVIFSISIFYILRNFPLVKEYGKNMNNHLSNSKLKKTMVYIGRVDFYARDLDFVLYCLADLPDWKLHIYATEKMDVIQHLKKLTYELKLNERVTFHEPVPYYKLHTEINQYYLGIIPHKRNLLTDYTVPNKLYDYILSGLKVLFSNNPSLLEENEIYNFGMSYEAGNKEDFINKIRLLESKELPEINDKELDWNVNMDRVFNSLI